MTLDLQQITEEGYGIAQPLRETITLTDTAEAPVVTDITMDGLNISMSMTSDSLTYSFTHKRPDSEEDFCHTVTVRDHNIKPSSSDEFIKLVKLAIEKKGLALIDHEDEFYGTPNSALIRSEEMHSTVIHTMDNSTKSIFNTDFILPALLRKPTDEEAVRRLDMFATKGVELFHMVGIMRKMRAHEGIAAEDLGSLFTSMTRGLATVELRGVDSRVKLNRPPQFWLSLIELMRNTEKGLKDRKPEEIIDDETPHITVDLFEDEENYGVVLSNEHLFWKSSSFGMGGGFINGKSTGIAEEGIVANRGDGLPAMVHDICIQLGGKIRVVNQPPSGETFNTSHNFECSVAWVPDMGVVEKRYQEPGGRLNIEHYDQAKRLIFKENYKQVQAGEGQILEEHEMFYYDRSPVKPDSVVFMTYSTHDEVVRDVFNIDDGEDTNFGQCYEVRFKKREDGSWVLVSVRDLIGKQIQEEYLLLSMMMADGQESEVNMDMDEVNINQITLLTPKNKPQPQAA